jgi:hypothetical protein
LGFQRGYSLSRKRISPLSRTPAPVQGICKHIMLAITPNTGYNISLSKKIPQSLDFSALGGIFVTNLLLTRY